MVARRPEDRKGKSGAKDEVAGKSGRAAARSAKSGRFVTAKSGGWSDAKVSQRDARAAVKQVVYGHSTSEDLRAARLREGAEIVAHVKEWAGGMDEAGKWYRSQPIPALGGRTAEALVMTGEASLVREYLDHLSQGGHA